MICIHLPLLHWITQSHGFAWTQTLHVWESSHFCRLTLQSVNHHCMQCFSQHIWASCGWRSQKITWVLYSRVKKICLPAHSSVRGWLCGKWPRGVIEWFLAAVGMGGCEEVEWLPENTGNFLLRQWTPPVGQTATTVCILNHKYWYKTSIPTEPLWSVSVYIMFVETSDRLSFLKAVRTGIRLRLQDN